MARRVIRSTTHLCGCLTLQPAVAASAANARAPSSVARYTDSPAQGPHDPAGASAAPASSNSESSIISNRHCQEWPGTGRQGLGRLTGLQAVKRYGRQGL